jgi:hypothetical protein
MARPVPTSLRLDPEIKAALEKAAAGDGRSMANMMDRILRAWLTDHGHFASTERRSVGPEGEDRAGPEALED